MPETNWGRKETIIWPPHKPIYTFGAVFLSLILTGLFVYNGSSTPRHPSPDPSKWWTTRSAHPFD